MSRNAPLIRCVGVSRNATQIWRAGTSQNAVRTLRRHELISLREELAVLQTENTERIENAKKKALRVEAEMAFLTVGGARAISRGNGCQVFFRGSA
jgi:hypothetical protein